MKSLPVGTAYGVWVGIGTVIIGIMLLGESASAPRMISVALIVAGIVGLKLSASHSLSTLYLSHPTDIR